LQFFFRKVPAVTIFLFFFPFVSREPAIGDKQGSTLLFFRKVPAMTIFLFFSRLSRENLLLVTSKARPCIVFPENTCRAYIFVFFPYFAREPAIGDKQGLTLHFFPAKKTQVIFIFR